VETDGFEMSAPHSRRGGTGRPAFSRVLSFALPRGCYATVLLAAMGH
jgi:tRNA(Glu) U13 pseudouridine synthase TruD